MLDESVTDKVSLRRATQALSRVTILVCPQGAAGGGGGGLPLSQKLQRLSSIRIAILHKERVALPNETLSVTDSANKPLFCDAC